MSPSAKYLIALALFSTVNGGISAPNARASGEYTLPPFRHTVFCLRYPADCKRRGSDRPVVDTPARRTELDAVNRRVNASIMPQSDEAAVDAQWRLAPPEGNCNDYAVTKRHALLQKSWPTSALRLAEVTLQSGEHHLVLVATMEGEAFILDNLNPYVLSLAQSTSGYTWIRIESGDDPKYWRAGNRVHEKIRKLDIGIFPAM